MIPHLLVRGLLSAFVMAVTVSLACAAEPSADMQAVLDKLADLDAKPIHTLSVP